MIEWDVAAAVPPEAKVQFASSGKLCTCVVKSAADVRSGTGAFNAARFAQDVSYSMHACASNAVQLIRLRDPALPTCAKCEFARNLLKSLAGAAA